MDEVEDKQIPLGILLVLTLWILIATYFFSLLSGINNSIGLIIVLSIATFFIFLGWGLISFNKWAYFVSVGIAFIGAILSIIIIPSAIVSFLITNNGSSVIAAVTFACFIPASIFLYKTMSLYYVPNKPVNIQNNQTQQRMCTNCFKSVPYNSQICPYCGYKYETYL